MRYTLGDRVKVQVARADLERKQLDFALIDDKGNPNKPLPEDKPGKRHEARKGARKRVKDAETRPKISKTRPITAKNAQFFHK